MAQSETDRIDSGKVQQSRYGEDVETGVVRRDVAEAVDEEPMTPAGRFFLQPRIEMVIICMFGLKFPVDLAASKAVFGETVLKHPRFCSVVVRDNNGFEHWKRSEVDIDKHIIIPELSVSETADENFPNRYAADLAVSSPLDLQRPLWEIHILQLKMKVTATCCILRMHHSLGDGISMMSLFLASCRRVDEPNLLPTIPSCSKRSPMATGTLHKFRIGDSVLSCLLMLWKLILVACFTFIDITYFMLRSSWLEDSKTLIRGGAGVELWPRKLSTATFSIDDMRAVKNAVNGTINDVVLGIVASGFRRYLDIHCLETSKKGSLENPRITGLAMVNTRPSPGLQDLSNMMKGNSEAPWGNKFGYILLPLSVAKCKDPLDYVRKAKVMVDRKKLSLEAIFSYKAGALTMRLLGPEVAAKLVYKMLSNTTFSISNVMGPVEEVMFAGNPITYLRPTISNSSHAITMHMLSYMGKAEMQILVAKDIIPDPEVLAKFFEDSLQDMKEAIARE